MVFVFHFTNRDYMKTGAIRIVEMFSSTAASSLPVLQSPSEVHQHVSYNDFPSSKSALKILT